MTPPSPYLHLPGTAREALAFYARVFGGRAQVHTLAELGRTDGPADAVAHGYLVESPVELFAADAVGEPPFRSEGLMFALLGTSDPATLRGWFDGLADGGRVVDDLQRRPWGASDGQVVDRFGVHWLVGFEDDAPAGE
ncbi:VOC family protein [Cellulomonas alba]|uniref:VOC family protein n=1 Tax=Cellulomonas alba TaxID=3053467 RepID=A0ABT7SJP9_9CELL|nr:VOC family protein [Cellulomonas alba]MDM7856417.1 VOC family protein [Cellulomonas alba]